MILIGALKAPSAFGTLPHSFSTSVFVKFRMDVYCSFSDLKKVLAINIPESILSIIPQSGTF